MNASATLLPRRLTPMPGDAVAIITGRMAGYTAVIKERRSNGIYRVVVTSGPDKGIEVYGLRYQDMEKIKHD